MQAEGKFYNPPALTHVSVPLPGLIELQVGRVRKTVDGVLSFSPVAGINRIASEAAIKALQDAGLVSVPLPGLIELQAIRLTTEYDMS